MIKKTVVIFLCFLALFFTVSSTKLRSYVVEIKTLAEIEAENIQLQAIAAEVGPGNYKGLSEWLSTHIKWKEDRTPADEWKEPHTTISDGTGDCEDYAVLALEVLKRIGVKDVFLLGIARIDRNLGHVVCIFKESNEQPWRYYDFEKLKTGPVSFRELLYTIARECRYGSKIGYQLADINRKNIPPGDEKNFTVLD